VALRLMTKGGKFLTRNGKLLVHREGQTNRPCCCPDEDPPDPGIECGCCTGGATFTPATMTVVISDVGVGSAGLNSYINNTYTCIQDQPGSPCFWRYISPASSGPTQGLTIIVAYQCFESSREILVRICLNNSTQVWCRRFYIDIAGGGTIDCNSNRNTSDNSEEFLVMGNSGGFDFASASISPGA